MNIAYITGSRSDYGPFRKTLKALSKEKGINLYTIVHGTHLLKLFGNSIKEIQNDKFGKIIKLNTIKNNMQKFEEMENTTKIIYKFLKKNSFQMVIIIGDRLEAYASALAAHFANIPILHSGGGHFTYGAIDNIYRFNITNLSNYHFATSIKAYKTLQKIPTIQKKKTFFTGSATVDSIKSFLKSPLNIDHFIPELKDKKYVLMTFHPVTLTNEPIEDIIKNTSKYLIDKNINVLITYPNNDYKSKNLISTINRIKNNKNIHVIPHLSSIGYFSAVHNCEFVIGNSSSGIMEVPYFKKHVINIGTRQDGRALDRSVTNVDTNIKKILNTINLLISGKLKLLSNQNLYGKGDSVKKSVKIIKNIIIKEIEKNERAK